MIVAISYHDGDRELMKRWANHVEKLGPYPKHSIILAPAHGSSTDGILEALQRCFDSVDLQPCHHAETGWPISCNMAFERIAWHVSMNVKQPFLFMEPDAIPLCSEWIDKIETEYIRFGRPFMGDFVNVVGKVAGGVNHMSGVAVYHWNLHVLAPKIFRNERIAWDIVSAPDVVPKMQITNLIQHDWVPTAKWRRDKVDFTCVKTTAVIYHPDKLGVLMNDGLSPNDVQGDPAMGGDLVAHKPHETKELLISNKEIPSGTPEAEEQAILRAINTLSFHASISTKNKKKIKEWLCEKDLSSKAKKRAKRVRSKVLKNVGINKQRSKLSGRTQISSNSKVEV